MDLFVLLEMIRKMERERDELNNSIRKTKHLWGQEFNRVRPLIDLTIREASKIAGIGERHMQKVEAGEKTICTFRMEALQREFLRILDPI